MILLDRKKLMFQKLVNIIKFGTSFFAEFCGELGIKLRLLRKVVSTLLGFIILYVLLEFAVELLDLLVRKIEAKQLEL